MPIDSRSSDNYMWILQNGESPREGDLENMWHLTMKRAEGSKEAMGKQGIIGDKGLIYGLIFLTLFIHQT